ncbi:MAG: hypothetical protein ACOX52_01655 [Verrucomicrobiota bacterium]
MTSKPTRKLSPHRLTRLLMSIALAVFAMGYAQHAPAAEPIPVIYDSDIGDDIDDTWALGLLLKSPELDLKLVVGDYGKATYRAKIFAKMLETAGRTDVPVGLGLPNNPMPAVPKAAGWKTTTWRSTRAPSSKTASRR